MNIINGICSNEIETVESDQNRTEQRRTEQNRTEQYRTEQFIILDEAQRRDESASLT